MRSQPFWLCRVRRLNTASEVFAHLSRWGMLLPSPSCGEAACSELRSTRQAKACPTALGVNATTIGVLFSSTFPANSQFEPGSQSLCRQALDWDRHCCAVDREIGR